METENQTGYSGKRHRYQIIKKITRSFPMRNNSLPNRNATTWNLLPTDIVEADNVSSFKTKIDRNFMFIEPDFVYTLRIITTSYMLFHLCYSYYTIKLKKKITSIIPSVFTLANCLTPSISTT
jgi:hypothetical protein